jgi:hypothetical protein
MDNSFYECFDLYSVLNMLQCIGRYYGKIIMNKPSDTIPNEENIFTVVCFFSGIVSFLPFLLVIFILLLFALEIFSQIPGDLSYMLAVTCFPFEAVGGFLFGTISFISGHIALRQIKKNQGTEEEHRRVILGIIFGVLGVITNILILIMAFFVLQAFIYMVRLSA